MLLRYNLNQKNIKMKEETITSSWVIEGVIRLLKSKAKEMDNNDFTLYYSHLFLLNNRGIRDDVLKAINVKPTDSIDIIYKTLNPELCKTLPK